jgi:DNA-binding GntR family transcriptional regulator
LSDLTVSEVPAPKSKVNIERAESAIYRDLRDDIAQLVRKPGDRLRLEELARYYGTSFTPIRQALGRLESDGLVVTVPRRGSQVAPLTFDELEEILTMRLGVEPLLARLGAERAEPSAVEAMQVELDESERALRDRNAIGCFEARSRCRDLCYEAADRPRLHEIVRKTRLRTERFVLSIAGSEETLAGSVTYHRLLIEACAKRDGALAQDSTFQALAAGFTEIGRILDPTRAQDWDWLMQP